jgi:prophage regulatory protein
MSAKLDHSNHTPDQLPATGYNRASEILKYLPFGKTTLWTWSKDGRFVAPVKIGCMTCWKCEDVHMWLAQQGKTAQAAANDGGQI